jgi:hypothetical protein
MRNLVERGEKMEIKDIFFLFFTSVAKDLVIKKAVFLLLTLAESSNKVDRRNGEKRIRKSLIIRRENLLRNYLSRQLLFSRFFFFYSFCCHFIFISN